MPYAQTGKQTTNGLAACDRWLLEGKVDAPIVMVVPHVTFATMQCLNSIAVMTDAELMRAFYNGDDKALDELVRVRWHTDFRVKCFLMGHSDHDEDHIQNTHLKIFRTRDRKSRWKPGRASPRTWARRILVNDILDCRPCRDRKKSRDDDDLSQDEVQEPVNTDEVSLVRRCLQSMPIPLDPTSSFISGKILSVIRDTRTFEDMLPYEFRLSSDHVRLVVIWLLWNLEVQDMPHRRLIDWLKERGIHVTDKELSLVMDDIKDAFERYLALMPGGIRKCKRRK